MEKMRETRGDRQRAASLSLQSFAAPSSSSSSTSDDDGDYSYNDHYSDDYGSDNLSPLQYQQSVLARQTDTTRVITDGFPTGLPAGTPLGVKIALASTQERE